MDEERRRGFIELKASLDAVQTDIRTAAKDARSNRAHIEEVQKAVAAHDKRTELTGFKVDTVVTTVARIEDKMDAVATEVTEVRVHGQDTREGLHKTREQVGVMHELLLRHDEQIAGKKIPAGALVSAAIFGLLVFTGYHLDKDAMDATVAALKGLF